MIRWYSIFLLPAHRRPSNPVLLLALFTVFLLAVHALPRAERTPGSVPPVGNGPRITSGPVQLPIEGRPHQVFGPKVDELVRQASLPVYLPWYLPPPGGENRYYAASYRFPGVGAGYEVQLMASSTPFHPGSPESELLPYSPRATPIGSLGGGAAIPPGIGLFPPGRTSQPLVLAAGLRGFRFTGVTSSGAGELVTWERNGWKYSVWGPAGNGGVEGRAIALSRGLARWLGPNGPVAAVATGDLRVVAFYHQIRTQMRWRLNGHAYWLDLLVDPTTAIQVARSMVMVGEQINPGAVSNSQTDNNQPDNNYTFPPPAPQAGVPVLLYHHLVPAEAMAGDNGSVITVEDFRDQMNWLVENGFTTLSLEELADFVAGKRQVPEKSVVITFDDGYESVYRYAYPILKSLGMRSAVFLIGSRVGSTANGEIGYLNWDQVKEMQGSGLVEFGSHTFDGHGLVDGQPALVAWTRETIIGDARRLHRVLEQRGIPMPTAIAYPGGAYTGPALAAAGEMGYRVGFTVKRGYVRPGEDPLTLRRIIIFPGTDLQTFEKLVRGHYRFFTRGEE